MLASRLPVDSQTDDADLVSTSVVADGETLWIAVAGEVDMSTAPELADAVADVLRWWPHQRVRIDLAGVRFLDSSGVKALLDCRRRADQQGRELLVTDCQPIVRRVLQITGVLDLLVGRSRA